MDTETDQRKDSAKTHGERPVTVEVGAGLMLKPRNAKDRWPPSEANERPGKIPPRISEGAQP